MWATPSIYFMSKKKTNGVHKERAVQKMSEMSASKYPCLSFVFIIICSYPLLKVLYQTINDIYSAN